MENSMVVYEEPLTCLSKEGEVYTGNMQIRVTVKHCIDAQRNYLTRKGYDVSNLSDEELLEEFLIVNLGWVEENKGERR